MSRPKGSKNYGAVKPWDEYGLTEEAYRKRLRNGIPLDAKLKRGRKKSAETLEYERLVEEFGESERKAYGRFSGKDYENSEERLNEIREKYKNGVTDEIVFEFVNKFFPKEC